MNAVPRIPLSRPSITDAEVALVTDAIQNGWGDRCYDYIHRFEKAFADHVGVRHAIATSSCTGALHMGMAALGIGPGDEVIYVRYGFSVYDIAARRCGATMQPSHTQRYA